MDQFNIPSSAPPPPSEVKVRTMHSDLDMMAKSGGGMPQFENVHISGLSMEKNAEVQERAAVAASSGDHHIVAIVVTFVVVAVIAAIAYIAIYTSVFSGIGASMKKLVSGSGKGAVVAVTNTPPATAVAVPISVGTSTGVSNNTTPPSTASVTESSAATTPLTHISAFTKPADQTIAVALAGQGSVQSIADLETYGQRIQKAVNGARQSASFIEIDLKSAAGQDLSASDIFDAANVEILDKNMLSSEFDRDATLFVYRDKNGMWPGYVLRLGAGQNELVVSKDAKGLEGGSGIAGIFLSDAGTPAATGFTDSTISNLPVRELSFQGAMAAHFVYGWDKNFLIISASENGFAQAVAHLN